MSSNFRQIRLLTTELAALERLKHQCCHFFSVGIDPILFKVGGYIDMHILHDFEFWPNGTADYGVSWLSVAKLLTNGSLFIFDRIIKVAGNKDMHKSLQEFDF